MEAVIDVEHCPVAHAQICQDRLDGTLGPLVLPLGKRPPLIVSWALGMVAHLV